MFTPVIQVMTANHPILCILPKFIQNPIRSTLYRSWSPTSSGPASTSDYSPSMIATLLSTFGAASEFLFPTLLLMGGRAARVGLFVSISFHVFILSNVAMGGEW